MFETVKFSVQLDCHAKILNLDDQTKKLLLQKNVDYESVPVLKEFKVEALRQNLKENVDRKYRISYYKGVQLFLESVIIFLLFVSLLMKANLWSIVYLLLIFKYCCTRSKTELMVRMCSYLSVSLTLQYLLFLLNLTSNSSPQPFPNVGEPSMENYPVGYMDENDNPLYVLPVFFQLQVFRDNLMISYMLGVGVDKQQVVSLTFDFINLFVMTMYIFEFRNPILNKSLKKVFWAFPSKDDTEQWARLDKQVQKQVDWIFNPKELYRTDKQIHPSYSHLQDDLTGEQKHLADAQHNFACEYNRLNKHDLNYLLTTYVDLKYQAIWGEELLKEKKGEIKKNCMYYRLVKQGSQLIYVSFHIITIFIILLMSAMRQSFFGIIYVLILLPYLKDGAAVLKQRDIQQGKELEDLEHDIEDLKEKLKQENVKKTILEELARKLDIPEASLGEKKYESNIKQLDILLKSSTQDLE